MIEADIKEIGEKIIPQKFKTEGGSLKRLMYLVDP